MKIRPNQKGPRWLAISIILFVAIALLMIYPAMWIGSFYLSPLWAGYIDWWQTIAIWGMLLLLLITTDFSTRKK